MRRCANPQRTLTIAQDAVDAREVVPAIAAELDAAPCAIAPRELNARTVRDDQALGVGPQRADVAGAGPSRRGRERAAGSADHQPAAVRADPQLAGEARDRGDRKSGQTDRTALRKSPTVPAHPARHASAAGLAARTETDDEHLGRCDALGGG